MELYRLIIPKDDAWKVIERLGFIEAAHFVDLNKDEQPYQLPFTIRIKLCDETEKRIRYLLNKCAEFRIKIYRPTSAEAFMKQISEFKERRQKGDEMLFDDIEQEIVQKDSFVKNMVKQIEEMQAEINKLDDFQRILDFILEMLPFIRVGSYPQKETAASINDSQIRSSLVDQEFYLNESERILQQISFSSGTIHQEDKERLQKLLFRTTRGKALTYFCDFIQNNHHKSVYIVVFPDIGDTEIRVKRICQSF